MRRKDIDFLKECKEVLFFVINHIGALDIFSPGTSPFHNNMQDAIKFYNSFFALSVQSSVIGPFQPAGGVHFMINSTWLGFRKYYEFWCKQHACVGLDGKPKKDDETKLKFMAYCNKVRDVVYKGNIAKLEPEDFAADVLKIQAKEVFSSKEWLQKYIDKFDLFCMGGHARVGVKSPVKMLVENNVLGLIHKHYQAIDDVIREHASYKLALAELHLEGSFDLHKPDSPADMELIGIAQAVA